MAKRRRKVNIFRLLLVMILMVLIALLLAFGISKLLSRNEEEVIDNPDPIEESQDSEKKNGLVVDVMDYEVYESDKLDFGFAVTKIRFKDEKKINLGLDKAITSENIVLSKVSGYIRNVKEAGYSLNSFLFDENIVSDQDTKLATLFVPFKTKNQELTIDFDGKAKVSINLSNNKKDIDSLVNPQNETVIKNDYEFEVTKPNGYLEYYFESGEIIENTTARKVYEFIIEIKNMKDGVSLKKATYVTSDGVTYEALPNEYTSYGNLNMIESQLKKGEKYCLLFKVPSSDSEPMSYKGELNLEFTGSDEVIKLKADLN